MTKNTLLGRDIIQITDLSKDEIDAIIQRTRAMRAQVLSKEASSLLAGKIMAALFYEPSSRTFGSFVSAMQRLGGGIIPLNDMSHTSVSKGETLEDTVRTFSAYADVIVMRHPDVGALTIAAKYATVPVISAGEGALGEHPTQACTDLFTIQEHFGRVEGLNVLIIGDLAHYRSTNSLVKLLAYYPGITLSLVSPAGLPIQKEVREYLQNKKVNFREYLDFRHVLPDADVLYVTRVKKEYMSQDLYRKTHGSYILDNSLAEKMKKSSIIMHCLPRIDEIDTGVDMNDRAIYFSKQLQNSLYVRMALLSLVLGGNQ